MIVENPKGSYKAFRRATTGAADWADYPLKGVTYPVDYGYLQGFTGEDRMGLDVFKGSGDKYGYVKIWKVDVPSETKFFMELADAEIRQVVEAFKMLEQGFLTEAEFRKAIEPYRDK